MNKIISLVIILALFSCQEKENSNMKRSEKGKINGTEVISEENSALINPDKNTVRERFSTPNGYEWISSPPKSYAYFLEHFPLKKYGSPIVNFKGEKITSQNLHEAILDIDVGDKDLQQCADAIIRLRAEYLKKYGQEDKIAFHYTSGDLLKWNEFKKGGRLFVNGNKVTRGSVSATDSSSNNFKNYLQNIFNYAGTISQFRETTPVGSNADLRTGDILIAAGSPGHVVFIAGVAQNDKGQKIYLLGEGFTPAQSVSIMKNPYNRSLSPWYELDVNSAEIRTSRYVFSPVYFRRYP